MGENEAPQRKQTLRVPSINLQPYLQRLMYWLSGRLDRTHLPEEFILIGTALVVGLGAGLGAVAFRYLISGVGRVGYQIIPSLVPGWGKAYVVIVPLVGGALVGPMIFFFAREAKGHGVPEVMEAIALRGGRIRPQVAVVKALASSLCIGSGGSVGREGPIVQIGAALGSSLGQVLRLSDDRTRNLVACGAAGGIAATFNAPIAGVIFALELILGEFSVRYFSTVVISAVAAGAVGRAFFGDIPAFAIPTEYQLNCAWEFLFYPILGALAALTGVVFTRALYWTEDLFDKWKAVPEWVQPAVGGALLGGLALAYPLVTGITWDRTPQIFNVGYDMIEAALTNQLTLSVVLALLVLKLLATSLTLGSGGSGGVFAPSLFMGAMLGSGFGRILNSLFPAITAPPGAYALVGMAAVFSAAGHAPITAVLILFELTGDYRIVLPLMLTTVVATALSRLLMHGESVYTLKLTRRGIHLRRGRDVDVLQGVLVEEIMTHQIDTVTATATIVELSEAFTHTHHHGFPVLDENGKLWGIVTIVDLERAVAHNMPRATTVAEIATPREKLLIAYPDEPIGDVLARMSRRGLGRIPVVSRDDPGHLLGLIRRADIVDAYNVALTRRTELRHRAQRMEQRSADEGTEFIELTLGEGHQAVGKAVREVASTLHNDCILISIRRGDKTLIPHGNTVLQPGDHVTAFVRTAATESLYACLLGETP